jgi:hypothetical protein
MCRLYWFLFATRSSDNSVVMSYGGAFVRRGDLPRVWMGSEVIISADVGLNLYEMAEMGEARVTVSRRKS